MEISLITDEISADPETAIELGVEWGVKNFELRGYYAERVPRLTSYQKDKLQEVLERYQARIVALSPGLFKFPLPTQKWECFPVATIEADIHPKWKTAYDLAQVHLNEILPESIAYARELGTTLLLAFSFQRGGQSTEHVPDVVLESLRKAAEMTAAAGMKLAIEVEAGFWADTGSRCADMLKAINHPALGVNWDPANAFEAGDDPYPDGYLHIRNYLAHVHFKDIRRLPDGRHEYVVGGDVDWAGQIQALARDGYPGFISIETHMQPKVSSNQRALQELRKLQGQTIQSG
jgi:sugar phosphate isomerase/epimerase